MKTTVTNLTTGEKITIENKMTPERKTKITSTPYDFEKKEFKKGLTNQKK